MGFANMVLWAVLVVVALVTYSIIIKLEADLRAVLKELDAVHAKMQDHLDRYDTLKKNFMKVLLPIRTNAEDVAELDDDLERLQLLYEKLKKQVEDMTPPPASS